MPPHMTFLIQHLPLQASSPLSHGPNPHRLLLPKLDQWPSTVPGELWVPLWECGFQSHHSSSKPTLLFLESGAWVSYVRSLHGGKLRLREAKSLTSVPRQGWSQCLFPGSPMSPSYSLTVSYGSLAHLGPLNQYHPPKATTRRGRQAQDALPSHTGLEK